MTKKSNNYASQSILIATTIMGANVVFAQGTGIAVGETDLYPSIGISYDRHDNVLLTRNNEKTATSIVVTPSISWRASKRLLSVEANYLGEYSSGSEPLLEYDSHALSFGGNAELSKRLRINSNFSIQSTNNTYELLNSTEDPAARTGVRTLKELEISLKSSVEYGTAQAKGNLGFSLGLSKYMPGSDTALFRETRADAVSVSPAVSFSLRISPDTRWISTAGAVLNSFSDSTANDSTNLSFLTGLSFSQSGLISGEASIGMSQSTNNDDSSIKNSAVAFNISLLYKPLSYSSFTFQATRGFNFRSLSVIPSSSPNIAASTQENISTKISVNWDHLYSSRVSHNVSISSVTSERPCPENIDDQTFSIGANLNVTPVRWLTVGLGMEKTVNNADGCADDDPAIIDAFEYDSNIFKLFVTGTL